MLGYGAEMTDYEWLYPKQLPTFMSNSTKVPDDGFPLVESNNPAYWQALNELGKQGRLPERIWNDHRKSTKKSGNSQRLQES